MTIQHTTSPAPRLSVIIPAYKCSIYLSECIESVLNQTYRDIEVIVVEDCSPDDGKTFAVAKSYEKVDSRVKAMRTPQNNGSGMARNFGLQFARGEFIIFVDGDDTIDPAMFEDLIRYAEEYEADIVRCPYDCVLGNGKVTGAVQAGEPIVCEDPVELRQIAANIISASELPGEKNIDYGGSVCCALFRHSIIEREKIRFPEIVHFLSEDYCFSFDYMMRVRRFVFLPRTYYHYRMASGSTTHNNIRVDMVERVVKSAEYFEQQVKGYKGHTEKELNHARGYVVASLRGYLKLMFMSDAFSFREKRKWFHKQQDYPMMKVCYESYPWRKLRFKHRLSFWAFYKKHFLLLYTLIVGQEKVRKLLGKI